MSEAPPHRLKTTIAIIGAGDVGSTIAYTLLIESICSEVIIVDPKEELLEGQVRDLGDATYGGRSGTRVRKGTHKEAGQADVVVITAGAKQKEGTFPRNISRQTDEHVTRVFAFHFDVLSFNKRKY
jgi:L-lactate dehydrogenase